MMEFELSKTYEDMLNHTTATQEEIDNARLTSKIGYFLSQNLGMIDKTVTDIHGNLKANSVSRIYPDRECISELLNEIENYFNSDVFLHAIRNGNKIDVLLHALDIISRSISQYFGSGKDVEKNSLAFHYDVGKQCRLALLSDFKGKNCAKCLERSLATHTLLSVISNNTKMREDGMFPYTPFIYFTSCNLDINNKSSSWESHALCGLIHNLDNDKMYLFDPSVFGEVIYNEKKLYVPAIYALSIGEMESLMKGNIITPELLLVKENSDIYQNNSISYSNMPYIFNVPSRDEK